MDLTLNLMVLLYISTSQSWTYHCSRNLHLDLSKTQLGLQKTYKSCSKDSRCTVILGIRKMVRHEEWLVRKVWKTLTIWRLTKTCMDHKEWHRHMATLRCLSTRWTRKIRTQLSTELNSMQCSTCLLHSHSQMWVQECTRTLGTLSMILQETT